MTGEVGKVDPSLGYITWFMNVVELYQKRKSQFLCVCQPRSPGERLPEGNGENHQEGRFKLGRGDGEEGRLVLSEKWWSTARRHPR